jgi:hypothetical protein
MGHQKAQLSKAFKDFHNDLSVESSVFFGLITVGT